MKKAINSNSILITISVKPVTSQLGNPPTRQPATSKLATHGLLPGLALKIALIFSVFAFFEYAFSETDLKIVEAEGSGYTRDQAIGSALRAAVEKSVGTFVASQTKIENFQTVSDKILAHSDGYVSHYEVLPGTERKNFGLVFLKVKAEVKTDSLRSDLEAIKLIYSMKNMPRIMVVVDEVMPGTALSQRTAATVLERELLAKGFTLIDREQLRQIQEQDVARSSDMQKVARIGFRFGADLIINGIAEAGVPQEETVYSVKQWRTACIINLRLIRADNAQIISSVNQSGNWASQNRLQAANSALSRITAAAARQLVGDLLAFWKNEAYNTAPVDIHVKGMDNKELSGFLTTVLKISGVRQADIRYIEGTEAILDAEISGTIQQLREAFTKMNTVAITAMTANRIDIEKIQSAGAQRPDIQFEIAEPDISIVEAEINPLFPCIYSYYEKVRAGNVSIENNSAEPVDKALVSVSVPVFAAFPTATNADRIPAHQTSVLDFRLLLDQGVLNSINEPVESMAQIELSYTWQNQQKKRKLTVPFTIQRTNAVTWATPGMAASFITPNNPVIRTLAADALRACPADTGEDIIREIMHTASIYCALRSLGIAYIKDPNGAPGRDITDVVNYPAQTLKVKSGDCDDTSVLLASLLESIGMETALVVYPDHVLVMFNTGVYKKNSIRVSYNPDKYIVHKQTIWIPVETTQFTAKTFLQSWESAMGEFNDAVRQKESITIVDVHDAWKTYPSRDPLQQASAAAPVSFEAVRAGLIKEINDLKQSLEKSFGEQEKRLLDQIHKNPDASPYNTAGILYARNGLYDKAQEMFTNALAKTQSFSAAANNLANVFCLQNRDSLAVVSYDKAIGMNREKAEYCINKGLALLLRNNIDASIWAFRESVRKAGSVQAVEAALGIPLADLGISLKGEDKTEPSRKGVTKKKIQMVIKQVLDKVPDTKIKDYSKNNLPVGGLRGADPEQIEKIADLLWWDE